MEKTYSQKVARVFEIICYLLLIPTFISLIFPFLMVIGGLLSARIDLFFSSLIPFLITAPGFALLAGYSKHSRGYLSKERVSALWTGTAVYNSLLLLPWLYYAAAEFQARKNYYGGEVSSSLTGFLYLLIPVFGYIFAIVFSMKAYAFEKRQRYI